MKRFIGLWVCLLVLFSSLTYAGATAHVICDLNVKSEKEAVLTLKWSDDSHPGNIQFVSAQKDGDILLITYRINNQLPDNRKWNQSTIKNPSGYSFPIGIRLSEQFNDTPIFSDLDETHPAYEGIMNLYARGIVGGYPEGDFRPDNLVQRSEFSKMVSLAGRYDLLTDVDSTYPDLPKGHWAEDYIMTLSARRILEGYPGGNFGTTDSITIGAVLKVIDQTFTFYNHDKAYPYSLADGWSNDYFISLVEVDIVKATDTFYYPYNEGMLATRAQCAQLLSRAISKSHEVNK